MHYIRYKSIICIVLACLSVLLLGAGCAQQEAEAGFSIAVAPGENPKVAPESLAKAPYTPQDYANPTGYEITYDGVTSVTLTIGGESLDLKEAVQAGKITPERLVYQAELDAAAGTCARKLRSDGKLTLRWMPPQEHAPGSCAVTASSPCASTPIPAIPWVLCTICT